MAAEPVRAGSWGRCARDNRASGCGTMERVRAGQWRLCISGARACACEGRMPSVGHEGRMPSVGHEVCIGELLLQPAAFGRSGCCMAQCSGCCMAQCRGCCMAHCRCGPANDRPARWSCVLTCWVGLCAHRLQPQPQLWPRTPLSPLPPGRPLPREARPTLPPPSHRCPNTMTNPAS
jgi:hypothetical protein